MKSFYYFCSAKNLDGNIDRWADGLLLDKTDGLFFVPDE